MSQQAKYVETINGRGRLIETESFYGSTRYHVAGTGFSGWYSQREILSELSDDETTTDLNFDDDTDDNGTSTLVPDEDPHAEDGVELPWDPSPTEEWGDGQWTTEPEHHDIDLSPTKSTKGLYTDDDPDTSTLIPGKRSSNDWDLDLLKDRLTDVQAEDPNANQRQTKQPKYVRKTDSRPAQRSNVAANQKAATKVNRYIAFLESDSMAREAAWEQVRAKANRLYREGHVEVEYVDPREIVAKVKGDNGTYEVEVHRKNAFGKGITWFGCSCEWGKWAYQRQRTFIGRLCSHALSAYYAMQSADTKIKPKVQKGEHGVERHTMSAISQPSEKVNGDDGETGDNAENFVPDEWDEQKLPQDAIVNKQAANKFVRWNDDFSGSTHDGYNVRLDPEGNHIGYSITDRDGNGLSDSYYDDSLDYGRREPSQQTWENARAHVNDLVADGLHRQGGLLIWDDDLHKAIKNLMPQADPATGGAPVPPPPSALSADPASADPMAGGDPAAMGADPAPGADPSLGDLGLDPSMTPPGADPSSAPAPTMGEGQPFYVRSATVYPQARKPRVHWAQTDEDWDPEGTPDIEQSADDSDAVGADFVTWDPVTTEDATLDDRAFNEDQLGGWKEAGVDPELASYFEDDDSLTYEAALAREAEEFNDREAQAVVEQWQRGAGRKFMAGRVFSYDEQQELIDEEGTADQLGRLDLNGTHYL